MSCEGWWRDSDNDPSLSDGEDPQPEAAGEPIEADDDGPSDMEAEAICPGGPRNRRAGRSAI